MVSHQVFSQLVLFELLWRFLILLVTWPRDRQGTGPTPSTPVTPLRKRSREPTPFVGLAHTPHCAACAQDGNLRREPPCTPPPPLVFTRGRRRQVDTAHHFCPDPDCRSGGWTGLGNISANGHPSGGPWRQLHCSRCGGDFLETHDTLFHGQRVAAELIVRVLACLAEGLGIRGTARVFEVDPNTVLHWLGEAAEQLRAFSQDFLHDLPLRQGQRDALYAVISALNNRQISADEASERLSRSPRWVWVAMDPESKLLLTIAVGERTLAMAQRVVHHMAQVLAPDCAPLFLTDGFRAYMTALLTHYGHWIKPERRQAQGPAPKPRWMPLPQLLYAQVVKTVRRRRLVNVSHRVVFGTLEAVEQVLAACGWQINTAFIEVRPVGRKEASVSG